jgi:hypothetical protein
VDIEFDQFDELAIVLSAERSMSARDVPAGGVYVGDPIVRAKVELTVLGE